MQLSLAEINELAKAGIGMQTWLNDEKTIAVDLAREFIAILTGNSTSPRWIRQRVLEIMASVTERNTTESAVAFLEKFEHLPMDKAVGYEAYWTVMMVISGIIVALRIISRLKYSKGLRGDDWIIILAWIVAASNNILDIILYVYFKWEEHCWNQTLLDINLHFKVAAADQYLFCVSSFLFKLALLFFYYDICLLSWFRGCISLLGFFVAAYTVLSMVFFGLRCKPFDVWNHPFTHHCIPNDLELFYTLTIVNILIDLAIVGLPMIMIARSRLSRAEKFSVVALIGIGILVCIASLLRLMFLKNFSESNDVARRALLSTTWVLLEAHLGIMCASVPALKKMVQGWLGYDSATGTKASHVRSNISGCSNSKKAGQIENMVPGIDRVEVADSGEDCYVDSGARSGGKNVESMDNEVELLIVDWESKTKREPRKTDDAV